MNRLINASAHDTGIKEFTDKLLATPSEKWLGLAKEEVKRFGLDKVKDVGIKR